MIRYADTDDLNILRKYDTHIQTAQLQLSINEGRVLIAEENASFAGWLRYNLFWDSIPFINMLYFLESYRNKGWGREILRFFEQEMVKKGYKKILTSTLSSERAQFFYRKNGYMDCGSLILPDEPLEIILMKEIIA
ncbi:MAG: GNAT family N-acetyltransferase [Selenomonadales bacterium]|nr:MAG: GNAT family N-acetyltransferase [Selenomonadales bacterium]